MSVAALRVVDEAGSVFDDTAPDELSDAQLGERIVGFAGQIAVLTSRFFDLLVEFDTRHGWSGHGIASCAHWLSWKAGMSQRTAQDHLRVAHALTRLPLLHEAFARGTLSYSKVRALTRVATPEREEELRNVALSATAAQVERLVRSLRQIDRREDEAGGGRVESQGRWRWNDDGTLSVTMRLAPLDGTRFLAGRPARSMNAPALTRRPISARRLRKRLLTSRFRPHRRLEQICGAASRRTSPRRW